MLRDLKFLRRNSGKNTEYDEPENVPVNGKFHESSVSQIATDSSSRPPLNAIRDPVQNPSKRDQELGFKSMNRDRTPTKVNSSKHSESGMPMKTPETQGGLARNRYGWASDSRNEVKNGNTTTNMNTNTPRSCRTVGRAVSSGYSDCNSTQNTQSNSTQNTPTKSVNKPPNPGLLHGGNSRPPISGGVRNNGSFSALSRGFQNTYTAVNTMEVPHFDLKEDPSFWMDHNVQVLIRIRPLNNMELSAQGYNRCLKQESSQCLTWVGHPETRFTFDHVACETIDQETLFRMVGLPMVENCLSGYNSCIFAYGQTGSGKTHTMLGEINELEVKPSPYRGMTPRMFEFLFARIIAEEESRMDERLTYNCKCSFLEIYNEQITDLLDPSSTNLQLREDVKKGVYVENLTECEVHTVGDILRLLSQGSSNRRVAATNMNRESSRSHSVFTCVIESRWEKDSTSNLRFARLNLVDLAGSERQKTSGAEGERLKEAANINKSLSTLGHVIMVLVDGANARTRHVPYRDSRLTFLLQDSLGGNSKTMIIANVSPSICSATETLNTLKFAQRAKLIQNNAVVNEDASGDIMALQQQIQLLKEELATLKRNNVSRSLAFGQKVNEEGTQEQENDCNEHNNKILKVSSKQLKSLETSLTGALRREQMSETSIKHLEAEIEQLNRLVRQREDDNKCTKMMLKFREDKIHRMKSLIDGLIPSDSYMLEENNMLIEEIQMLRAKVDRNPEVTRFALENIRLLEQLRRFQDFYEQGEREMLLKEVSELRNQLVLFLDENKQYDHNQKEAAHNNKENNSLQLELEKSHEELEKCRNNLNSCLERNEKLCKEIADLNTLLENQKSTTHDNGGAIEVIKEPILEAVSVENESLHTIQKTNETEVNYIEEVMNLELELDILKMIFKEENSSHVEILQNLKSNEEKHILMMKQYEDLKEELEEAKSVIEALEAQQLVSINEVEALRNSNDRYTKEKELQNDKIFNQESEDKLKKMKDSLEKAKKTNNWYKTDKAFQASNEEEMDEVRKQVEAETAEVIVCLQDEVCSLQEQLNESIMKEREINSKYEEKEREFNSLSNEIYDVVTTGHEVLEDVTNDLDDVTVFDQLQMITRTIFEKESRIKELSLCLEDAKNKGDEMETMLMSLRGATLVMTEAHQEDCSKKDRVISQLIKENKKREEKIKKASLCAMVAFVIVNRFQEMKDCYLQELKQKECEIEELKRNHIVDTFEAKKKRDLNMSRRDDTIILLKKELETALGSLNGVKSEMSRLHKEKESIRISEKQNHKSIETLMHQVIALQSVADYFENQIGSAIGCLDHKIQTVEEILQESCKSCSYKRKLYELELMDMKVNAAQQEAESYCVLAKFEEAHDTIQEADVMINELVIANETMKLEIQSLKKKEVALVNEMDTLKENYEQDVMGIKKEVNELEGMIMEIQSFVDKDLMETVSDLFSMKSHLHDSSKLIQSWLDDIWSEIIMKDCAVSVLRVCHMGILLQTVTGLNAENNLLHNGLHESNCIVSQLKDQNVKSRKELEMCRVVQGKLLADIKNSFDRVSKNTEETGVISMKLSDFEKRILSLQIQEEKMVERSNCMGSELSALVKEINGMDKDEEVRVLEEKFMLDLFAKEIEFLVVSFVLKEMDLKKLDLENENNDMFMVLEKFKEKMIMDNVHMGLKDSVLLEKEGEFFVMSLELKKMDLQRESLENENESLYMVLEKFKEKMIMGDVDMHLKDSILLEKEAEVAFLENDVKEKEIELLNVSSRLEQIDSRRKDLEIEQNDMFSVLEKLKENMIMGDVDMGLKDFILLEKEDEVAFLNKDVKAKEIELFVMSSELKQMDSHRKKLENENDSLYMVFEKFRKDMIIANVDMYLKDSILLEKDAEVAFLNKDVKEKESELFMMSSELQQMDSKRKNLENENDSLYMVLEKFKEDMIIASVDMELKDSILLDKDAEVAFLNKDVKAKEIGLKHMDSERRVLENENHSMFMVIEKFKENMIIANVDMHLKDSILLEREDDVAFLEKDVKEKEIELLDVSSRLEQMDSQRKDLETEQKNTFLVLEKFKENMIDMQLKDSILLEKEAEVAFLNKDVKEKEFELLILSSRLEQLDSQRKDLENENNNMFMVLEKFKENIIMGNVDMQLKDSILKEVKSENVYLQSELERKDEVVEGLLFDLHLLQESSSKNQDKMEELETSLKALENELNENIIKSQVLESEVKKKVVIINTLESDISRERELVKSLFSEIQTLKDALKAYETTGMELVEVKKGKERLELELVEMESLIESRTCEILEVRKELEMAQALAEENEAIATESKQIAETSRLYAEEKEEEVKVYEKSVEELDCMVTVLENQVEMVKGDAERQKLKREELELEFHAFKQQINQVKTTDSDMKRILNEKEKSLQEVLQRVELLEKEIANKDKEIGQHKAHISELNLNAEAQAREYKQTFKTLEAMADQVKSDASAPPQITNSPLKKLEKNGSRTRGSGSPFKCIGIGLVQQMKSERDEELTTSRKRIEELETLAATRQKEIFALNAKLAMSGSMTHDVLRDLLGIKLDMTNYSSMIDGHQIEEITEKARIHNAEVHVQEEEVIKLKEQLNELVMERKGRLEEIERKQSEMITSQVALEQLRQRDRLLKTENEMFKTEIANLKMKVIELESEVKKLSGQQNIQQRIHHHMKIKEENNLLKNHNDELSRKLRRTDDILSRVKEELANLRATSGKDSYDVESELQISEKLKITEEERDHLAQKLAALCTSILKAAGVTRPTCDVSILMAEEALEQLQGRVATLERELQDLQYKNRIGNERVRLSEMMPQTVDDNRQINNRASRSPFLSSLDR